MPPNLACTHGPATGTFPARDSPGNWGENRQIFSKSLLQHFSEAQCTAGLPGRSQDWGASSSDESQAAPGEGWPQPAAPAASTIRDGFSSHGAREHAEPCGACSGKGFPEGSPPAMFHHGKRDPRGWTGNVRPGSMRQLPKARAWQDVCQEASSAHLGPALWCREYRSQTPAVSRSWGGRSTLNGKGLGFFPITHILLTEPG